MLKGFFNTVYQKIMVVWRWLKRLSKRDGNPKNNDMPTYTHCLNCGEELVGMYCHKCGQYASPPAMNMWEFIKEYFRNVLSVESQLIPTLINLVFHPGKVSKEYSAGRHASYLHPLKLNLFILVVLITLFSIFGTDDKVKSSFEKMTDQDAFVSEMTLSNIMGDEAALAKAEASPRNVIKIVAAQEIVTKYPRLVEVVELVNQGDEPHHDTLVVSVPRMFIDEGMLVEKDGIYHFVDDNKAGDNWVVVAEMKRWWEKSVSLVLGHFPLFMLLTAPLFVFPLRLLLRRRRYAMTNLYIFALYYIAFVELLLTLLFICGVMFGFTFNSVWWPLMVALLLYLAVALKNAYELNSWVRSLLYAVVVNVVYFNTILFVVTLVSIVTIVVMVI